MRTGILGINHKLATLPLREALAKTFQKRFQAGFSLHGEHRFVLLNTCNRTEIYFSSPDVAATHTYILRVLREELLEDFTQLLYAYFGVDSLHHLARVAAGLDSAILAETEIQGQVRHAYSEAAHGFLPSELHFLFQKGLRISKMARASLSEIRGMPDLEHAALHIGRRHFGKLEGVKILLVGASEINRKLIPLLGRHSPGNIMVCNRTQERAEAFPLPILPWEKRAQWMDFDWLIFGTKAADYLLRRDDVIRSGVKTKLVIDLSVPRNVEPSIPLPLYNIDKVNGFLKERRAHFEQILQGVEEGILDASKRHVQLFQNKQQAWVA